MPEIGAEVSTYFVLKFLLAVLLFRSNDFQLNWAEARKGKANSPGARSVSAFPLLI